MNDKSFEELERLEQDLIHHLRASGVRKPRETSLIEEVMVLRRERRKVFSSLTLQLNKYVESYEDLKIKFSKINEDYRLEKEKFLSLISKFEIEKRNEILKLDETLKKEFKLEIENNKAKEKDLLSKVKIKYDEKVKLIETKLNEIIVAKQKSDFFVAEKIAKEMVCKVKDDLESKYLNEIRM
jgi:hypothetical protein